MMEGGLLVQFEHFVHFNRGNGAIREEKLEVYVVEVVVSYSGNICVCSSRDFTMGSIATY